MEVRAVVVQTCNGLVVRLEVVLSKPIFCKCHALQPCRLCDP